MNNKNSEPRTSTNPFPQMEEDVLNFWDKAKTFEKSIANPPAKGEPLKDYVFYDGPPFATGLPHYGHIVASVMKDAVPRYWTMKGYRVERKWGWDCHGLPIENLAEKELGLKDKTEIEKMGVEKFNEYCESIVLRYAEEWKKIIRRIGRWVDTENDYKTMDPNFMESVWWVFKTLWDKGLIYQGHKAMHICPRCGTTLANFEVTLGYKDIKDMSLIAKFELLDPLDKGGEGDLKTFVLAWTTTPWTLIGNVALAVGEEIVYQELGISNSELGKEEKIVIAKERVEHILKDKEYKILREIKGKDLIGKKYKPLFDYFVNKDEIKNKENGWQIYPGDFVTTEDGTGVVHIAPAFGEDDMELGKKFDLPFIQHVDSNGRFTTDVLDWPGREVKAKEDHMATDIEIIKNLAGKGLLFAKEKYEHSYPHCWRCDTPLLNYATSSWFVEVTKFRDKLISENQKINWVPDHIRDGRFGKWLEQARDWAISRNRYWGAPLPIWICDSCEKKVVIGSREDLKKASGQTAQNLHKQYVDKITWPCECGGEYRRIPEVLDCWFESGSMPYGQEHYPFENKEKFDRNFPAEFIAEGIDQTRGWFYTMLVQAVALFDKTSFNNVIVNGIVLAEDGQKMSKRLQNYPDPSEIFEKYSVDAVRYYLLASPVLVAENLNFSENGVKDVLRNTSMTLWNVYKFYELFADNSQNPPSPLLSAQAGSQGGGNVLDQWIITRLNQLVKETTENMDKYIIPKAIRPIEEFINDFSTWYLRRSRDRFKGDDQKDKEEALATTKFILTELSKVMAPFMPFIAEQLWQKVTGNNFQDENKSVHLEAWPKVDSGIGDLELGIIKDMEMVRKIVELGLAERDKAGIKVRQPLPELRIKTRLQRELASGQDYELRIEFENILKDELNVKNITSEKGTENLLVELDTNITPELKLEGLKRDIVRQVNALRKNNSLTINDKITLAWQSDNQNIKDVFAKFNEDIKKDTLSNDIVNKDLSDKATTVKIEGEELKLEIL